MAYALNQFLAAATADTIRCTNQFEVVATSGYDDIDKVLQTATIFGNSFTVPSRTNEYANVSFKGFEMVNLVPTKLTMTNEHVMNIYDDVNGSYRRAFLAWMNKVIDADVEGGTVFAGDRGVNEKSIIRLNLFDKDNETVIQTYKFYNVHVKSVGDISLTWEGGDVSKFDVTFNSTYWTFENLTKGEFTNLK